MPRSTPEASTSSGLSRDFMASIVVFLVALPLCMGVAIASGAPPALGLVTGIIGGIVVGIFAGAPLQVSGPAAGLAIIVWQLIADFGLAGMAWAVLIAGGLQLAAGIFGLGRWFRAVSPAVIQGMLAGIGVLIFGSQFHVMFDSTPEGGGLANLAAIPQAIYKGIFPLDGSVHHMAAGIGLLTILSVVLWTRYRPKLLKSAPGALVGVVIATVAASFFAFPIDRVAVPTNLMDSMNWLSLESASLLTVPAFWGATIGLAVIASAETLLCATATDRLHTGERTNYNKELRAQGIGNLLCGVVGALPLTGVIVRSSANIEAGGETRWSAVMHGGWILLLVVMLPGLLALIPTASLAAVLVFIGWKLINIRGARTLAQKGRSEIFIWAATVVAIVSTNLLIGVVTGFVLALGRLLLTFTKLQVEVRNEEDRYDVELLGAATFMSLPKLAEALESIPNNSEVHVHLDRVAYIDHACIELIESWHELHPGEVYLETDRLIEKPARLYAA